MEDFERYGDYNDTEDDAPKRKSPLGLILKIAVAFVCLAVAGVLVFRIILFNYYPAGMKNIYFDDVLTEYYNSQNGKINAKTQGLRAPYDDADKGNFFCDNLIVISGANQLQISVRFNNSLVDAIEKEYGVRIDPKNIEAFKFSLARNPLTENDSPTEIGRLDVVNGDSKMMYRYFKLVFNDVDFGLDEGEDSVKWIRLEITIDGVDKEEPFMIPIYENNEIYDDFENYKLSSKEVPGK